MPNAKVKTYVKEVRINVKGLTQKGLEVLAFQIEGQTKVNIRNNGQVDTGFMLNSAYTVTPDSSGYGRAQAAAQAAAAHHMAPEAGLGKANAAVCVGAEYAVFQEARLPFLFPAAEKVARQVGATLEKVFEEAA